MARGPTTTGAWATAAATPGYASTIPRGATGTSTRGPHVEVPDMQRFLPLILALVATAFAVLLTTFLARSGVIKGSHLPAFEHGEPAAA